MKKNKNKNPSSLILKSFIVIAVLMILTDVLPSQAIYSQTQKTAKAGDPSLNELVSGTGASANDNFGWNVSYAGDLNGDNT